MATVESRFPEALAVYRDGRQLIVEVAGGMDVHGPIYSWPMCPGDGLTAFDQTGERDAQGRPIFRERLVNHHTR